MKPFYHPTVKEIALESILYALADPTRLKIIKHLIKKPSMSCQESCTGFDLPKATLSRHYDILRSSGLVFTEKKGVQYTNKVRLKELNKKFPGLLNSILDNYCEQNKKKRRANV